MKKISFVLSAAFVLFALASCQKEVEVEITETPETNVEQTGSIPFVLQANLPQTKTTLNPSDYTVAWGDGDIVYAVTTDSAWGSGDSSSDATAAPFTYSGSESSFSTSTAIADGEHTFYFVYEPSSQVKYHRTAATTFNLQATQTQNCNDATAHIRQNDVLAGKLTATTPTKLAKVDLAHVNALMQFNITNDTGADATLTGFDITFDGASIAGVETISFAGATASASVTASAKDKITVNLTNGSLPDGETLPIYFVMAPLAGYTGNVTINVYNSAGGYYTKTSNIASAVSFAAGSYNRTTVTISNWVPSITFTRINTLADLTDGDYKYVIVGQQTASSFGILTYGTLNSGKLNYVKAYDALPATTLELANLNSIWSLAVSTTEPKTATIYNAANNKYLIANSNLSFGAAGAATQFTVTAADNMYAFAQGANYLGVNKSSAYWRDYASSTVFVSSGKVLALYRYWEDSTLESIAVSGTQPTDFYQGDEFSYTGLVVRATYTNGKSRIVTPTTVTGPNMSVIASNVDVTVSYTEGGVTKNATYKVNVNAPASFTVTWMSNGVQYGDPSLVSGGGTLTLPAVNPTMAGNVFMGWTSSTSVNADGSSITYAATGDDVAGDITYYAVFAVAGSETTATLNVQSYGPAHSWSNGAKQSSATVDDVVFTAYTGGQNDGKYYNTSEPYTWRFYTSGKGLTVTTPVGSVLSSVKLTWPSGKPATPEGWTADKATSPTTYTPNSIKTNTVLLARDTSNTQFAEVVVKYVPYSVYKLTL